MFADIQALFGALALNGAGANIVIVAPLGQAAALKMQLGPQFNWPVLVSTAMASASVGAVDLTSFVSAWGTEVDFEVSEATVVMDTAPVDVTGGAPSPAPLVKAGFQVEMLALKAVMYLAWVMRVAGHAQLVQNVTW